MKATATPLPDFPIPSSTDLAGLQSAWQAPGTEDLMCLMESGKAFSPSLRSGLKLRASCCSMVRGPGLRE